MQVRSGSHFSRYLESGADFSSFQTMGDWRGGETELSSLLCRLLRSRTNLFTDVNIVCSHNKVISSHRSLHSRLQSMTFGSPLSINCRLILSVTSQYFQDILYPPRDGRDSVETVQTVMMVAMGGIVT